MHELLPFSRISSTAFAQASKQLMALFVSAKTPGTRGRRRRADRVLVEGGVFEKAGVNFSEVFGEMSPEFAKNLPGEGNKFMTSMGISLVLHPRNPMVPTVHANWRFLTKGERWWFGGGADLTPYYPFKEDVIHFHRVWKDVCDRHKAIADYRKMKKDCDEYFFLAHRKEPRGVGGVFFNYLDGDQEQIFNFVQDSGNAFLDAYTPIAQRRKNLPYTKHQRAFQEYRRGRYQVQPTIRSGYDLRPENRRAHRVDPDVVAANCALRLRLASRTRFPRAELMDYYLKPRDWAEEE